MDRSSRAMGGSLPGGRLASVDSPVAATSRGRTPARTLCGMSVRSKTPAALPSVGQDVAMLRVLISMFLGMALSGCTPTDGNDTPQSLTVSEGVSAEKCGRSVCLRSAEGEVRLDHVGTDLAPTDATALLGDQPGEYLFAVYDGKSESGL